jgi:hypothetical protein
MTQDSIVSKTSAQNLYTLTSDEPSLELDSLDWESGMAKLVGFEEEFPTIEALALQGSTTLEQSMSQPQEVQTKQTLSSKPVAKLKLVGTATLTIVLLAGGFLSLWMNISSQKPKNNIVVSQGRSQLITASSSQELEGEIEILKTKLALTEQVELIKATQQKLKSKKKLTPSQLTVTSNIKPSSDFRNKQPIILQRKPTPIQTVSQSSIVTVKRVAQPSQLPSVKPDTQSVVKLTLPPTPNPIKEWTRLAKLGSYGQVNFTSKPNNRVTSYAPP